MKDCDDKNKKPEFGILDGKKYEHNFLTFSKIYVKGYFDANSVVGDSISSCSLLSLLSINLGTCGEYGDDILHLIDYTDRRCKIDCFLALDTDLSTSFIIFDYFDTYIIYLFFVQFLNLLRRY
jgi:hypothetical protein